jgi:hypothetical protein
MIAQTAYKVIAMKKIQGGRQASAAILDFRKFESWPIGVRSWPPNIKMIGEIVYKLKRFKNQRWPPAFGSHLGYLKIWMLQAIALGGPKMTNYSKMIGQMV